MVLNPKHNQDVGAYGGRGAAPIWHDAMLPILAGQPDVPFPPAGLPLQDPHPPPPPPAPRRGRRPAAAGAAAAAGAPRRARRTCRADAPPTRRATPLGRPRTTSRGN